MSGIERLIDFDLLETLTWKICEHDELQTNLIDLEGKIAVEPQQFKKRIIKRLIARIELQAAEKLKEVDVCVKECGSLFLRAFMGRN